MKKYIVTLFIFFVLMDNLSAQNYALINGNWFDGFKFSRKTFYTVNGTLSTKKPDRVDSTINLLNGFVIPPFGDAHHHGIDSEEGLDEKILTFLSAGVFYVKNPNVIPDLLTPQVRSKINNPQSIDVVSRMGDSPHPMGTLLGFTTFC